jgi:nucleoside-diphosphate-sugar epimerase
MSKALITGGGGFIGTHLARRLRHAGYAVDLLDDLSRGSRDRDLGAVLADPHVRLLERDLLQDDALDIVDRDYRIVFHLAAIVGVANVTRAPYRVLDENVRLLLRVIEFASRLPCLERLVFASTSEVYAGTLERSALPIPTPEHVPLTLPALNRPRTSYLLSKLYGEALCLQSGLPTTVVRPHNVYGPRMGLAHVIPELLHRAHDTPDGGRLEVFSVDHRRTFCYVDDAVELIVRAAESPRCAGEVLNVGCQSPEVAIRDVAAIVVRTVGKDLSIEPLPPVRRTTGTSNARSRSRRNASLRSPPPLFLRRIPMEGHGWTLWPRMDTSRLASPRTATVTCRFQPSTR